jgi:hypothetical protein
MKNFFSTIGLRLALIQMGLLLCQNLPAAQPVFTITPTAVSNTYMGPITFQISGIPAGHTVVIQKFGDVVTNGAIAAGDSLVQQFNLTDNQPGMVIGGVTNFAVPFDKNPTNGVITASLPFPNGDFSQKIIGQYGFVLSSPVGDFTPVTNLFTVTNFPFGQTITGTVVSNGTSAVIPYAGVIFFPAPRPGHDLGSPVAGAVANNLGVYAIQVPPGTYVPLAFQSNYVASYAASPVVTLTNGQTITTNLTMTVATASISGKVVDALNTGIALPGLFVPANNTNYLIATGFTDTNGNFIIRVTSGQWQLGGGAEGLDVHGYAAFNDGTNVNAGTTGFVGGFYKANALFYGTVTDGSGNPLQGIPIEARDQPNNGDGIFDTDGYEDANGNYAVAAYGGLGSGDPWVVDVDNQSQFPNYIFSQAALSQNGGTNLAVGQAVQVNFTALVATNQISGNVKFNGTNVIGVQVFAYATIGGNSYQTEVDTDTNGNYSLNVANGNWTVNVYDCGCGDDDSLNEVVDGGNYQGNYLDPASQNVNIANNNGTANFTVPSCGGVSFVTTSPLPGGTNGAYYNFQFNASDCTGNYNWFVNDPQDLPPGLTLYSGGAFNGTPGGSGTYNFSVHVDDGNGHSANQPFSLYIAPTSGPLQVTTTSLPNANLGVSYSTSLGASGGQQPYNWSLAAGSLPLPSALAISTNGVISGIPATNGLFSFVVQVTDAGSNSKSQSLGLIINPKPSLGSLAKSSGTQFQFRLTGAANQNYTIQMSTNLSSTNWTSLFVTNNTTTNSFIIVDPNASNSQRFYRTLIGP